MYKLILTGTVISNPEKYYLIDNDSYILMFKFKCLNNSKIDHEVFEIICKNKLSKVVEKHIDKGMNLLIEGSPSVYAKKYNKEAVGIIRVLISSLQFLDSEIYIDESDSTEILEILQAIKEQLHA